MRVTRISRRIEHKLWLGGFETICPAVEMTAELGPEDDLEDAQKQLDAVVEKYWHREALRELRMVVKRRGGEPVENDLVPKLMDGVKQSMGG